MKEPEYIQKLINKVLLASIILYIAFFTMFFLRSALSWGSLAIASGIVCIQVIRLIMFRYEKANLLCFLMPVIEFILIIGLFYGTGTDIESIVFALYTIDIILFYNTWLGLTMAYSGYAIYAIVWRAYKNDILDFCISSFNYCVFIAVIWAIKVLLKQKYTILNLNRKILEQSSAMEDMAKLKERNRIAEEVHNTVGHKLTTAIVSLEGAHLLFEKKPDEAHKKLNIARDQLKEGLSNIREVVRTIKSDGTIITEGTFKSSMEHMISDVKIQTGINVDLRYDIQAKLLSLQEHVLLNAAKEGIINAIKHAAPGKIHVSLNQSDGQVKLAIDNDGKACNVVNEGFGLRSIRENSEAIGGRVIYGYKPDGFTLSLYIPVLEEE